MFTEVINFLSTQFKVWVRIEPSLIRELKYGWSKMPKSDVTHNGKSIFSTLKTVIWWIICSGHDECKYNCESVHIYIYIYI